ncbi:hypothetical protein [Streptomyces sp. NBC_00019]|uniref:hypothetical protein n=1 Tax=Streptomyces sp. NBC_00019 TaxID=2975623 RepID=UPI0032489F71
MHGNRPALLLVERACAVIVVLGVLYAAFLPLIANHEVLMIAYRRGGLTPSIIIIVGAFAGWLCLRLARRQRPPVGLGVAGLCAVALLAVMWWGAPGTVEKQDVNPPPGTGRFYDSQLPGNTPGTVTPPSAGP